MEFPAMANKKHFALSILLGKNYFGKPKYVIAHQIPIRYVLQPGQQKIDFNFGVLQL